MNNDIIGNISKDLSNILNLENLYREMCDESTSDLEIENKIKEFVISFKAVLENNSSNKAYQQMSLQLLDNSECDNDSYIIKIQNNFERWVNFSSVMIATVVNSLTLDDFDFSIEFLTQYFDYCSNVVITDVEFYKSSFNFFTWNGHKIPQETFDFVIGVLEMYPDLLMNFKKHMSDYIYNPDKHEQICFENCPICGGSGKPYFSSPSFKMADFCDLHLPQKLWMKCDGCGDMFTKYFSKECVMSCDTKLITPNGKPAVTSPNLFELSNWSNILNRIYAINKKKNLLEVGIGKGYLLGVALEMKYNFEAIEIVEDVAQKISNNLNIPIWCTDFLKFETDNKYSVIVMGDVIEHIIDPRKALIKAHDLLEDDGVIWLSTPNFESAYSILQNKEYVMWLEPYHITFFSYTGIEKLLNDCGLEIFEYKISERYYGSMELLIKKIK